MKHFFLSLLALTLLITPHQFYASNFVPPAMPQNIPNIDPFEFLNNMDPKELDKILDEVSRMSPEEIKYYEDLGKQIFKQNGFDLDAIQKQPAPQPQKAAPKVEPVVKPQPAAPENESSKKEKDSIIRMIKRLSESLASIRQKASTDETLHPHIASMQYDLDLLTAYINRLDFERHLKHLNEKEFAPLKTKLRKMSLTLEDLDTSLSVPPLNFKKDVNQKPSAQQTALLNKATSVLLQFKNYMQSAFTTDTIITDIEALFKRYDKDALEIKKAMEDQQKKASEQVRKLPTTNTGLFAPIPKYGQPQTNRAQGGHGGSGNYTGAAAAQQNRAYPAVSGATAAQKAGAPGQGQAQQAAANKNAQTKKSASETEKEKEATKETVKVQLTFEERAEDLKRDFKKLNAKAGQNKSELLRVASALSITTPAVPPATAPVPAPEAPHKEDVDALYQVDVEFKKLRASFNKFFTDLESKDIQKMPLYKKKLKDAFSPTELPELFQIQAAFEPAALVALTGAIGGNPEAKDGLELVKKFVENCNALKKVLNSTRSLS